MLIVSVILTISYAQIHTYFTAYECVRMGMNLSDSVILYRLSVAFVCARKRISHSGGRFTLVFAICTFRKVNALYNVSLVRLSDLCYSFAKYTELIKIVKYI